MKKQTNPENDYLRSLEAKEKAKARTKWILAGSSLAAVGCFAVLVPQLMASSGSKSKIRYESFAIEDLNQDKAKTILASDNSRLVITYPSKSDQDTVYSYSEYLALTGQQTPQSLDYQALPVNQGGNPDALDSLSYAVSGDEYPDVINLEEMAATTEDEVAGSTEAAPAAPARTYGFNLSGARLTGEELTIQIVNFDPEVSYELDFGNGVKQSNVNRTTRYSYPEGGLYYLKLVAREEGQPARMHASVPVSISSPSTVEEPLDAVAGNNDAGNRPAFALSGISTAGAASATTPAKTNIPTTVAASERNKPLLAADKMPSYPGGKSAMYRFIQQNIRYPYPQGSEKRVEGRTMASFVVDAKGNIIQPKILQSLGSEYDKEVYRVLNLMPRWRPGEQDGEKVAVYYQVLINFSLIED